MFSCSSYWSFEKTQSLPEPSPVVDLPFVPGSGLLFHLPPRLPGRGNHRLPRALQKCLLHSLWCFSRGHWLSREGSWTAEGSHTARWDGSALQCGCDRRTPCWCIRAPCWHTQGSGWAPELEQSWESQAEPPGQRKAPGLVVPGTKISTGEGKGEGGQEHY